MSRRSPLAGAVLASAALLLASCSSDSSPTTSAGPTSTVAPDTTAPNATDGIAPLPPLPEDVALPIVFVHGFAGSAQQYESQAMRFVANGYPQDRIVAYDHDGAGMDIAGYAAGVESVVDETLAEFDVEQVYLVGHSRGTGVSTKYLSTPDNAAKVAKYIAIDGAPCPAEVDCIAPNQPAFPGQAHVEVATSPESFAMQYEFLVGEPPAVTEIKPQVAPVVLSGRAVVFPANTGRGGTTLDVWAIDAETGQRVGDDPHATFEIGDDGAFGPLEVESGARYEFLLSEADSPVQHHLYLPPYVRSSDLVRLLSSTPDGDTRANTNTDDDHSSLIAIRMREWYAVDSPDVEGDERDVLEISVDGSEPLNAITDLAGNGGIGVHIHDDAATPGESTLGPLPYFSEQPFQSGVDMFLPATDDASGTITITNLPRGDASQPQVFNVPNWPSSNHSISLMFADYPIA